MSLSKFSGLLTSTEKLNEIEQEVAVAIHLDSFFKQFKEGLHKDGLLAVAGTIPANPGKGESAIKSDYLSKFAIPTDIIKPLSSLRYVEVNHPTVRDLIDTDLYEISYASKHRYSLVPKNPNKLAEVMVVKGEETGYLMREGTITTHGIYPLWALRGLTSDKILLLKDNHTTAPGGGPKEATDLCSTYLGGLIIDPLLKDTFVIDYSTILKAKLDEEDKLESYNAKLKKHRETQDKEINGNAHTALARLMSNLISPARDTVHAIAEAGGMSALAKLDSVYSTLLNYYINNLDKAHFRQITDEINNNYNIKVPAAVYVQRMLQLSKLYNTLNTKLKQGNAPMSPVDVFYRIVKSLDNCNLGVTTKFAAFKELVERSMETATLTEASLDVVTMAKSTDLSSTGTVTWDRLLRVLDHVRLVDNQGIKTLNATEIQSHTYLVTGTVTPKTDSKPKPTPAASTADKEKPDKPDKDATGDKASKPTKQCITCHAKTHTSLSKKCPHHPEHATYLNKISKKKEKWEASKKAKYGGTASPKTLQACHRCGSSAHHDFKTCTRCTICGEEGHVRPNCPAKTTYTPSLGDYVHFGFTHFENFLGDSHATYVNQHQKILQDMAVDPQGNFALCDNGSSDHLVGAAHADKLVVTSELITCSTISRGIGTANITGVAPFIGTALGINPKTGETIQIPMRTTTYLVIDQVFPFCGIVGTSQLQLRDDVLFKTNSLLVDGISDPFMKMEKNGTSAHYKLVRDLTSPFLYFVLYPKSPSDFSSDDHGFLSHARKVNTLLVSNMVQANTVINGTVKLKKKETKETVTNANGNPPTAAERKVMFQHIK